MTLRPPNEAKRNDPEVRHIAEGYLRHRRSHLKYVEKTYFGFVWAALTREPVPPQEWQESYYREFVLRPLAMVREYIDREVETDITEDMIGEAAAYMTDWWLAQYGDLYR